ncbi:unnamed protein product [Urochloa humidicola]
MGNSDSCHVYYDAYLDCLKSNKNSWSKCSSYRDMLDECQDRADAVKGPRSIKVVSATPTDDSDPCHIHTKAYVACLNNSKVPLGKCMDHAHMYNECCWRLDSAARAKVAYLVLKLFTFLLLNVEQANYFLVRLMCNRVTIDSTAQAKDPVNEVTVAAPITKADPCDIHSKAYNDCQDKSEMLQGKYRYHLKMLRECRRSVNTAAGPGMEKGKSCDIHSKACRDCFKNYRAMQKKCKHYRNMLDECRRTDD